MTNGTTLDDVAHSVARHPLVERIDRDTARIRSSARVLGLTTVWQELFQALSREELRGSLITRPEARLTYPMLQMLNRAGCDWVTEDAAGRQYPSGLEAAEPADVAQRIQRREATDADVEWLQIVVTVRQPARVRDQFGLAATRIAEAFGAEINAAGFAEPLLGARTPTDLSVTMSERLPEASRAFVLGSDRGSAQRVAVSGSIRTWHALERNFEETKLLVRPATGSTVDAGATLVKLARELPVQFGSVWQQYGREDLTIGVDWAPYARPLAMLIGQRVVRDNEFDREGLRQAGIAQDVVNHRAPALLLNLGTFGAHPSFETRRGDWERIHRVIDSFGSETVARALLGGGDA